MLTVVCLHLPLARICATIPLRLRDRPRPVLAVITARRQCQVINGAGNTQANAAPKLQLDRSGMPTGAVGRYQ